MTRTMTLACGAAALFACGCANQDVPPRTDVVPTNVRTPDGVEYRAETRVLESFPVQLHTTVSVTNTTANPVNLELPGGCPVLLRAYRAADTTRVAFEQGSVRVCTMQLLLLQLAPGETQALEGRSDAREILGDSLPDGQYVLRAVLRPNGRELVLPAGEAALAVPR